MDVENHSKCSISKKSKSDDLCKLCLLRSLTNKINSSKGRVKIKPTEYLAGFQDLVLSDGLQENISSLFELIFPLHPFMMRKCHLKFNCATCSNVPMIINLDIQHSSRDLFECLGGYEANLQKAHSKHEADHLKTSDETSLLFIESLIGMSVKPRMKVKFMGKKWQIKSIVSDFEIVFLTTDGFKCNSQTSVPIVIENVNFIIMEEDNQIIQPNNELEYSGKVEYDILREKMKVRKLDRHLHPNKDRHLDPKDRHLETEKRKQDRHMETEKRKHDRHLDPKDRHLETEKRKEDRHQFSRYYRQTLADFKFDTGMDICCCICMELKSKKSCVSASVLTSQEYQLYVVDTSLTRNSDGNLYICSTCRKAVKDEKEPVRCQKELYGFLDFPESFTNSLTSICLPSNGKTTVQLNKLEDFILKLAIPFIRIGHLPRGRYFKVKGDLIMISADLKSSLDKILPCNQNLIPVSFKRNLKFKGNYFLS